MAEESADMTDIFDEDFEPSAGDDILSVPIRGATLVNSPTTDTLDSVALEPSPTDENETAGDKDSRPGDEDVGSENQDGITFQASNESSVHGSSVQDTQAGDPCQTEAIMDSFSQVMIEDNKESNSSNQPSLSSYFGAPSDSRVMDFFDTLSEEKENEPTMTGNDEEPLTEAGVSLQPVTDESKEVTEDVPKQQETELGVQLDIPLEVTSDRFDHGEPALEIQQSQSQTFESQPESIPFEGETLMGARGLQGSSEDLLNKSSFESFTAQGGEQPGPSGDGNEVSKSTSQEISGSDNLYPGYHQSQPASVIPMSPSQLSPLSTPVHQPALNIPTQQSPSSYSYSQPPGLDRQTSLPSAPTSPYRQFDSTPGVAAFSTFADGVDDPFTSSLSTSDADRRYDAWLPSDATRHVLITMATSAPGSYLPPPEQLSCPRVATNEPQGDPVRDLVFRYIGEQEAVKRKVLTAVSVPQDVTGLEQLISAGCLRAAVDLTGKLLADAGQGETTGGEPTQQSQYTLKLWFCRLSLLIRLRLYEMADTELRGFQTLDTPDLYYEFYPQIYPGRRGSMVPFGMRVLHAELPSYLGRSQEALDKLYYLLAVIQKMLGNLALGLAEDGSVWEMSAESRKKSTDLWCVREVQTLYKIAAVMVYVKDYEAALSVYEELMEKDVTRKDALRSGLGHIYLQMGNITDALAIFKEIEATSKKGDNSVNCQNAMNKGLVAMCQNIFSESYNHFKLAVQLDPQNTCAVNNMAVCSLYLGRLKDALNTLESLVHQDPANNLHEGILFNLCTLYELESSRALHKKQAMLDLVSRHKGDGFPVVCLKMT